MPMAARTTDTTSHGTPLSPGPGSPDVMIGFLPAWRALPAGVGAGIESASNAMQTLMSSPALTPADATANLAQAQAGFSQAAGAAAAKGNAGAPGATASAFTTLQSTNATLSATYATASAAPGGQPAATIAYTEGIKAAAAAAASAAMSAIAGMTDMHVCPIPVPIPPHGPGVVTQGSKSVLINNLPAVRQNDKVFEAAGGPDPIAMGCPTVLIGDDGGPSSGGGAAVASSSSATAQAFRQAEQAANAQSAAAALASAAATGVALVQISTHCSQLHRASQEKKHRIAIRVVDDITDQPIAGVTLKLTLPDGRVEPHTTDGEGLVEVDDLEKPGVCSAACELKGARLSRTYDFVGMGTARLSPPGPTAAPSPRSGPGIIAKIEEHKVQTGESIQSLANANGMTWQELAQFNWDTAVPTQINEHLRDDVGCSKKTRDGNNYMFDSSDDPGIIYIPKPWAQSGLATDQTHVVRVRILEWPRAWIRLDIKPDDAAALADQFTLSSTDGAYSVTKTVKDDLVAGDDFIDLRYSRLLRDRSYKLVVKPEGGSPFSVFEDVPYEELARLSPSAAPHPHPEDAQEDAPAGEPKFNESSPDEGGSTGGEQRQSAAS